MGWFKDLLPAPARPAPPMPEAKPPKKDISEPVITLLKMLEQDDWEIAYEADAFGCTWAATNTNKKDIVLILSSSCLEYGSESNLEWMTYEEKREVIKAIDRVNVRNKNVKNKIQRAQFAIKLGVTNGLV